MKISVIVPVFNELKVLPLFIQRTTRVLDQLDNEYEIIFIDDGSQDGSRDYLIQAALQNDHFVLVLLSRNFGKEAALSAGLAQAQGDAVIVIDADLQDPPELIPDMIAAWQTGADVVNMKRKSRQGETWTKRYTAHLYYRLLNKISDVPIPTDVGDFRLLSQRVVQTLNQLPERNRYMKGLFQWVGYRSITLEYDRDPRAAGETKWNYFKLLALAFEGITSFSVAPLRASIILGLLTAFIGLGFGFWIFIKTLIFGEVVKGYPSLVALITFLGGIQLISIGVLGEYIGKIYLESKQRPVYIIESIIKKRD